MRHLHTKQNIGSKSNVVSSSGTKVTTVSHKTGPAKRSLSEPIKSSKKRKLSEKPLKGKSTNLPKHVKESEGDKTQKKYGQTSVKRSCAGVKRLKKPNEKFKKGVKKLDQKSKTVEKVLKKTKASDKNEGNDGPPTLCETFSRITTMVAETVINEKENQKLTESLMGKGKKEAESSTSIKHKGEGSTGETLKTKKTQSESNLSKGKASVKKSEAIKKPKPVSVKSRIVKTKTETKKSKILSKKSIEKATLDNTENLVKVLKDEEIPLAFGKGIGTRRKSTAGSMENEVSEVNKSKISVSSKAESLKKKTPKVVQKKVLVKKEKKVKATDVQTKRVTEDVKKHTEKGKEEQLNSKEVIPKKGITKKESAKLHVSSEKNQNKITPKIKKKVAVKEAKSLKSKVGSETDGSNSDELTLNIIQKKTKKAKVDSEKSETNVKIIKTQVNVEEVKEEKVSDTEKVAPKVKKIKAEKEDKNDNTSEKKIIDTSKDKKKIKETESDTDEDLELKRILAKKLGRNMKVLSDMKKKKMEPVKSSIGSESDQRAKRLRLFGFWSGPKKHRVASLNALAKVHCLYENESKGVLAEIEKMGQVNKPEEKKIEKKIEKMGKCEKKVANTGKKLDKDDSTKLDVVVVNKRILRGTPGTRGAGKHWDMFTGDSTSSISSASSDESHSDTDKPKEGKLPLQPSYRQKMLKKEEGEKEAVKPPKRRRNNDIGVTMDLKDMVVRKRMASLNASAILAASYSSEKRSNRKDSSGTSTEDGLSSVEENDRFLSDDGDNGSSKVDRKKPIETEKPIQDKKPEVEAVTVPECTEYRHKKHFWKTKVESLKKSSKEKRNSPSPILADFGVEKDLSTTVLEKEKNDEINDDRERDKLKLTYPPKKFLEAKLKGKTLEGKIRNIKGSEKDPLNEKDLKKKYSKRKLGEDDVKNINIEKVNAGEKNDEYEYKSDSDNGQRKLIELRNTGGSNKKVAVIVNQDTDVTITGVYVNSTRSTHHEGFCSIAGMQYRISSTSHTQTEATAVLKTSTASEQTPPPTESRNCISPRGHKSYTPLSALSNMQPPAGAPPHSHLPPPPHHHHHLCGMGAHRPPPDHYLSHGPISHQRPISPLGRRHGCSSAFTAPHCSSHPAPTGPSSPATESERFGSPISPHGYFQPAGPLIHHHSSNSTPLKSQNLTTLDSTPTSESQTSATTSEEPAEGSARSGDSAAPPPPPPPSAAHHMGYPRGYPPYQGGYYQGSYYPPPPQSAHYQPPPPPSFHQHYHHHQDLCYPPGYPPSSYPPPGSYRRFLQPPPGYYSPELTYGSSGPPSSQEHGAQQMVVPGGPSSSYSTPLDPYPPPAPYYPGYSPGPGPACYSHPPSTRNLAFIEQTYQSCPCPMQLCPKNVHIGPLTGECKRPGALPLPPVALQLPQEPPGAAGPPSPARGSAGMPPQPSSLNSSPRPNWEGRSTKSISEVKFHGSDIKASKCTTEVFRSSDSKEICDLSLNKGSSDDIEKAVKPVEVKSWNGLMSDDKEKDNFTQGLLAISKDVTHLATKDLCEPSVRLLEDESQIKIEVSISPVKDEEISRKIELSPRKRVSTDKLSEEPCKRLKLLEKLGEVLANNMDGNKKKRKKVDVASENLGKKVKKVQKQNGTNKVKDENICSDLKVVKKNQKNSNPKAKLLKDRNETVEWKEGTQNGVKVPGKKEKKGDGILKKEANKILNRRKSNQEKTVAFPEADIQSIRKSKSCSPKRSVPRDDSPVRLVKEEIRRKHEVPKNGKIKAEVKGKGFCEHSKALGKKKNAGNGSKSLKQMSILSKSSQSKSKKPKGDSSQPLAVLKKFSSKKALSLSPRSGIIPKWSNGWSWDGESFDAKVYLTNDEPPVLRKCYSAMRHVEGDVIHPKDCILLKAGPRKIDLPFVAKVAALWENPDDGEMMVSLLWYYRPEHTDQGRQPSDQQDEIFASRHKDINSVACIEDKCFVLTYNEYCRYRKKAKKVEEGVPENNLPVPRLEQPYFRFQRQPPCVMAPDMVFFCRRVYDFRQKRLLKNPT